MRKLFRRLCVWLGLAVDYESEVANAIHELAQAVSDLAAGVCYDAATKYEGTAGEQRQIAATMFRIAQKRFGGVKYEGAQIGNLEIPELEALWDRLITGRRKR